MLLAIFLVLLLSFVQALLPGMYLSRQVGSANQMGPRDELPAPSRELGRAQRALDNLHETLPIFLTFALLSMLLGEQGWLSVVGAWAFFLGRVAHVVCYIRGLSPWRSFAFGFACLGLVLMAVPLVPHLWS
jgi:uncharacterized MAPEG superfamily protein